MIKICDDGEMTGHLMKGQINACAASETGDDDDNDDNNDDLKEREIYACAAGEAGAAGDSPSWRQGA